VQADALADEQRRDEHSFERLPERERLVDPVPPALEARVMRCLSRDRDARYPSAQELLADLESYVRSPRGVLELVPPAARRRYAAGEVIAREGEPAGSMYILERGRGEFHSLTVRARKPGHAPA
jgi:CRP-like cAMP-binding protein